MEAIFCAINSKYIHTCLAAHILINHIDKNIFKVDLLQYSINDETDIVLKNIMQSKADIYMFSVYIFNVEFIKKIISKLKKINPACKIILGGPEVSFGSADFLKDNPSTDIIILGEGELILNKLLTAITNNNGFDRINNIVYRQGNEIISTDKTDELINMNDIIFPYNLDNIKCFKNKIMYYESSRGCPYSCAYCMSANDKHLRYKSLEKVFDELTFFIENKVPIIKFTDRTFNADDVRAQKIWQFILENNDCTTFHFEISADILSEDSVSLLNKMPPHYVQLEAGVQSAKQQTLKAVNRKTDLNNLEHNLMRLTEANNMHIHTDLIAGLPYESYDDFKSSFNFV
ncbi:MAG: radical SAM protein, partial [Eubacteriaceae bacterium]|nr:radical SAM protein [Eubacteriaceae bacterium]